LPLLRMKIFNILLAVLLCCGTVYGIGTVDVVLAEAIEIETHLHSQEDWFERSAIEAGADFADTVGTIGGQGAWSLDAGNDDWSAWTQILGSGDTPLRAGKAKFDLHKFLFTDNERTSLYFIQVGFGASGEAAYAAGNYTTFPYFPALVQTRSGVVAIQNTRHNAGDLGWVRIMCDGQNTGTLDFIFGLHEYDE